MTESNEGDRARRDRAANILLELVKADKLGLVDYERVIAALYGLDLDE